MRRLFRQFFLRLRGRFRQRRYQLTRRVTNLDSQGGFLLDLGGGAGTYFSSLYGEPYRVILMDVDPRAARRAKESQPDSNVIVADAENIPLRNNSVNVTVCNSVIEHVADPGALAREIHRVSQSYFVQTPNREFPVETHSFIGIPFYHHLPNLFRRILCRMLGANHQYIESVRYLSEGELRALFPDATLDYEMVLGLKKSFYIYSSNGNSR